MTIASLEQWEKGYVAGVLDSDGAILIRRNQQTYSFNCYIKFVGTLEQMEKLQSILGLQDLTIHKTGNRHCFDVMKKDDVKSLLKRLFTYLTKKDEVTLALGMIKLHQAPFSAGRKKPDKEVVDKRYAIFRKYKTYKSRSGGHTTNWGEFRESLNSSYEYGNPEPSLRKAFDSLTDEELEKIKSL